MHKLGHLLFKTNGRISVKMWWLTQIALWIGVAITSWVWHKYGLHDAIFGMIGTGLMFWIRVNVNIKRLHDLNLSGWWLVLFESFPIIGLLALGIGLGFWIAGGIIVGGYLAGFITLGFIKGNGEANEHGEAP